MSSVRSKPDIRKAGTNSAGFSLVETVVVVMVILIIAAIAIPNLVHGKMRANEAAAVASINTVNTAEALFINTYPDVGYAGSLTNLGSNGTSCERPTSTNACLIMDETLTSGVKSGYLFEIVGDGNRPSSGYSVTATPESNLSGRCAVTSTQNGDVRLSTPGAPATGTRSIGGDSGGCEL
jgi:prepilin-type N-terminal cleavage/methylation domain-containing protein